jgi:hypothetical protein
VHAPAESAEAQLLAGDAGSCVLLSWKGCFGGPFFYEVVWKPNQMDIDNVAQYLAAAKKESAWTLAR